MPNKFLDIIDKLLMLLILLSILVFILYPFISVFKTALVENGSIELSHFSIIKQESYLIRNSLTTGIYTTILSTLFSIMIAIYYYMSTDRVKKNYNGGY